MIRRKRCSSASGSSRTASAATRPARSAAPCTRRFHGLLIAALPAPLGRTMMLNHSRGVARAPDGCAGASAATSRAARRRFPEASSKSSRSRADCRSGAIAGRHPHREARGDAAPAEHDVHHLSIARRAAGTHAEPAPVAALPSARRTARRADPRLERGRSTRTATTSRSATAREYPPLRLQLLGTRD